MPELKIGEHVVLFDEQDAELVASRRWGVERHGNMLYVRATVWPRVYLHRAISGAKQGERPDHKDRNGLNNRRSNLRLCDSAQNNWNAIGRRPGKLKGVYAHLGGFKAAIRFRGSRIYCGWTKTEDAAARLYDLKAIELHGEFACLNFPRSDYGPDAAEKYGKRPLLTPDDVTYILASSKGHGALAKELGWSKSLIHKVRKGEGRYAEWAA